MPTLKSKPKLKIKLKGKLKVKTKPEPEVARAKKAKGDKTNSKKKPLGEALASTKTKSCLTCKHFTECKDERKRHSFLCTRFTPRVLSASAMDVLTDHAVAKHKKLILPAGVAAPLNDGPLDPKVARTKERKLESMIKRVMESSGVIPQDARVDDRDLPTCPNFFTWVTDPDYAGNLVKPWAKQIEHPTKLFAEWCPKCSDKKWFSNVPVDATPDMFAERVQFLHHGICPRCKTPKSELVEDGYLYPYNELAGLAGQRASKTFSFLLMVTYDLQRTLKAQNPQAMLGLPSSQQLVGTFAALTFAQAKENIWDPLHNMLYDATWFQRYHLMLDDIGARIGTELYAVKDTFARYRHRNLLYAPSGPSKRTMRGRTRITAGIDEIGWFQTGNTKSGKTSYERLDAEGVHDALGRSLLTVRSAAYKALMAGNENVPMGYMYCVSSPSSRQDMIMTLYNRSKNSKTVYGYRGATWEINPTMGRNDPVIVEAFRVNYTNANRDYGAVPPISGSPFLKLPALAEAFHRKSSAIELLPKTVITKSGIKQTSGKVHFLREYNGGPTVLSIDAGAVNNSFAICVTEKLENGRARLHAIGEILVSEDAPAHFPSIVNKVIQPLIQHFNSAVIVADRWQSMDLLSRMEQEENVTPVTLSLKYPEFARFRQEAIYDKKLKLPALEMKPKEAMRLARKPGYPAPFAGLPMSHLLYQLVAVQDLTGQTVLKPEGGTDDLFRAVVLGWHVATAEEYAEMFDLHEEVRAPRVLGRVAKGRETSSGVTNNSFGVKRSYGGGGGGSSRSSAIGVMRRAA